MSPTPPFDLGQAHRWFSADFFNRTWGYLDQDELSCEDSERMLSAAHASLAHWQERDDATPQNLSIGYWQVSRVYAVLELGELAHRYGALSLLSAENEPPFYQAYAHEALARAAKVSGDLERQREHFDKAKLCAEEVADKDDRALLETDLVDLRP